MKELNIKDNLFSYNIIEQIRIFMHQKENLNKTISKNHWEVKYLKEGYNCLISFMVGQMHSTGITDATFNMVFNLHNRHFKKETKMKRIIGKRKLEMLRKIHQFI